MRITRWSIHLGSRAHKPEEVSRMVTHKSWIQVETSKGHEEELFFPITFKKVFLSPAFSQEDAKVAQAA